MKEAIRDYVEKICYGRSLETRLAILEEVLDASFASDNEAELLRKILDISRKHNS